MRRVVFDIECDSLTPTKIWCLVAYDLDTKEMFEFIRPDIQKKRLVEFSKDVSLWVGHNVVGFDVPVIEKLIGDIVSRDRVLDTLILSWLHDFRRKGGHSLEAWGETLFFPKAEQPSFDCFSREMVDYCRNDVLLNARVYQRLWETMKEPCWQRAIKLETETGWICNALHDEGFGFDIDKAREIQQELQLRLLKLDQKIQESFPPKSTPTLPISVKSTGSGSPNRSNLRWYDGPPGDFTPGTEFCRLRVEEFNPGSPKQVVERLHAAGWKPVEKTDSHKEWERHRPQSVEDSSLRKEKLKHFRKYGWKVSETNLATLPDSAPEGARLLVERTLVASRLRTLEEWFQAYRDSSGAIHGRFLGIGAWTHRKSHREPNMANIATEKSLKYAGEKLSQMAKDYGKRMRSLWIAKKGRVLVGTDADAIQLRILSHYLGDKGFIRALVEGRKEDGTDAHSLNRKKLGEDVCKDRDMAKTFIYALILGAKEGRVASILQTDTKTASNAMDRFINSTPGLKDLRNIRIPRDAARGYFTGLDGRHIRFTEEHGMLAGYLQSGESLVMKTATLKWHKELIKLGVPFWQVNDVHDEWQTETLEEYSQVVGETQTESIAWAGRDLGVECPLKGNFNIGLNWYETH